jgi:hypothetical protein
MWMPAMAAFKASFIEQVGNVARGLYAESGVEFRVCGAAASKVARDPTLRESTSWPSLLPAMEGEGLPLAIPPPTAGRAPLRPGEVQERAVHLAGAAEGGGHGGVAKGDGGGGAGGDCTCTCPDAVDGRCQLRRRCRCCSKGVGRQGHRRRRRSTSSSIRAQ